MKRILMTAAALMLGTSALAWAPADKSAGDFTALQTNKSVAKSPDSSFMGLAGTAAMAAWESAAKLMTKHEDQAKPLMASADSGRDKAKPESGSMDMAGKETGMGGPVETAATGYPPCDPGPGDDRCIQLYERGVHSALAQWKGTEAEVGMGGPYEPAPEGKPAPDDHQGMDHGAHGTGAPAPHAGHGTAATGTQGKPPAPPESTTEGEADATGKPGAVGGPFEPAASYPPCRPGPGDDRCIQLYERGVTGRKD